MKFTITKKQQNILFIFGVVFLTIFIAFVFIYKPKETKAKKLSQDLKTVEASLKNIHAIVGADSDLGKGILRLRDESKTFEAKFIKPETVSDLLETLSGEARSEGLEIVSMQPSEFVTSYNVQGKAIRFDDMECNKISIEMNLLGNYRDIISYMDMLENKNSLKFKIERFSINRQDNSSRLRTYIVIDCFALLKVNQ